MTKKRLIAAAINEINQRLNNGETARGIMMELSKEAKQKKREYYREYYRKNREKFKAAQERYWEKKAHEQQAEG